MTSCYHARCAGLALVLIVFVLGAKGLAAAQSSATGQLTVVVRDPSGAVIVGADVRVEARQGPSASSLRTGSSGVALFESLSPGRYRVRVQFAGFETVEVSDVRVGVGATKREVVLPIRRVNEDVSAGLDKQTKALEPGGSAFSTILTREQIDALPDDPDEMEAVLKAMAPPGSVIRVDGFSGGRLPPKSQIRAIRLPRGDEFAAENHGSMNGMMFIDIMTQPGNGAFGGSIDTTLRDGSLNARNPFTPIKGIEDLHQYGLSLSGPVRPGRSSFQVSVQLGRQRDSGSLLAALPGQTHAEATVQPTSRSLVSARFDQAIGAAHTLRISLLRSQNERRNLGVGGYDLPERAYATSATDTMARVSEDGPIGRTMFGASRLQLRRTTSASTSALQAPTVRVLDAFTSGGAQQSGGRRELAIEAATDLDFVKGSHSYRAGALVEGARVRSDASSNMLGTFTFSSLADFQAARASNYSRRLGDPVVRYGTYQIGIYAQDDYRALRSLLVSYGLRYETQSFMEDKRNWSPRGTATWAPFRNGKTTLRIGWGSFTDWIATSTFEQATLVDGRRFQELSVVNPGYPDPGTALIAAPSNRYVLNRGISLPEAYGLNLGVSHTLGELHVSASYSRRGGSGLMRGFNINVPVAGVRPDPAFADIVATVNDAASRGEAFQIDASIGKPRWHRLFANVNYGWNRSRSNTTGAFSRPASADVATEWGPTQPRHRTAFNLSMRVVRALGVSINGRAQSGSPYTVTSGLDSNRDGVFNDRPEGVGRNSRTGAAFFDMGMRVSYAIGFGQGGSSGGGAGGVMIVRDGPGASIGGFDGGADSSRFRVEIYASAQNVTNHRNYTGYSGVLTSEFFGKPTNVLNPRKIEIGARLSF
jgi:hypothetical protein